VRGRWRIADCGKGLELKYGGRLALWRLDFVWNQNTKLANSEEVIAKNLGKMIACRITVEYSCLIVPRGLTTSDKSGIAHPNGFEASNIVALTRNIYLQPLT